MHGVELAISAVTEFSESVSLMKHEMAIMLLSARNATLGNHRETRDEQDYRSRQK
jgi:hypothetical protein